VTSADVGVSGLTTFVGSSAAASAVRIARTMCLASAVTNVTDHDRWRARSSAARRVLLDSACTCSEQSSGSAIGTGTEVGTGSSFALVRKLVSTPRGFCV
jgi:hypothetical protein